MSTTSIARSVPRAEAASFRGVALALAIVWSVWGSTYLAMRVAVSALPPWGMAGARFVAAGAILLAVARVRGEAWPARRAWAAAVPTGFLLFFIGNGFVAVAEQSIASGLAAVVCATTPLVSSAMSALRGDKPSRAEIAGTALGFAGVAVLALGSPLSGGGWPAVLLLFAPVGFAAGSLLAKRSHQHAGGPFSTTATHMLAGGALMLGASVARGERVPDVIATPAILAWLYLVVLGSVVAFSAYAWLLRNARTSLAMSHAYVNPLVAVLLGALVSREPLGVATVVSAVLIASGVIVALRLGRSAA